jgi:hypothetical protein
LIKVPGLLLLVFITVRAAPLGSENPDKIYLDDYSVPVGYSASNRDLPVISGTLTDTTQAIAGWQLSKLRKKWIYVICLFTPKSSKPDKKPDKKSKCSFVDLPFPKNFFTAFRHDPHQFDMWKNWAAEYSSEIFVPEPFSRKDAETLAYPGVLDGTVFIPEINAPTVYNTDVAEAKSTSILTSAANFQMAQWIWRWNIILCLVNPSCPHVNIPSTTGKTLNGYPSLLFDARQMLVKPLNQYELPE